MKVLVSTFDDWSVLWKPFAEAWVHHWPDCPYETLFITNERDAPLDGAIKTGEDTNWTTMTRSALEQIDDDTVLFIHEDCWLAHRVSTLDLFDFASIVENGEADIVRLHRSHQGEQGGVGSYEPDPRLYNVDPSFPYAVNLQASFWNREVFLSLLEEGEGCWPFETNGSYRAKLLGVRTLCIDKETTPNEYKNQAYFCYINAVCRGHWRLYLDGDTELGNLIIESAEAPPALRKEVGI
jgi:hypothetical protein